MTKAKHIMVFRSITTADADVSSSTVFLNRQAAGRYRALASIIPGSENLSF